MLEEVHFPALLRVTRHGEENPLCRVVHPTAFPNTMSNRPRATPVISVIQAGSLLASSLLPPAAPTLPQTRRVIHNWQRRMGTHPTMIQGGEA